VIGRRVTRIELPSCQAPRTDGTGRIELGIDPSDEDPSLGRALVAQAGADER
jgi:hypothetical protein